MRPSGGTGLISVKLNAPADTKGTIFQACFGPIVLPPDFFANATPPNGPCYNLGEWGFRSFHSGGSNFAMGDGSVKFIKNTMNVNAYRAVGTCNLGEVVSSDAL